MNASIMADHYLGKLDNQNFQLEINYDISNITEIVKILEDNHILFSLFTLPFTNQKFPKSFDIAFSPSCNMDDLYDFGQFFSKYGLCQLYPKRSELDKRKNKTIIVGSCDYETNYDDKSVIAPPIPMFEFLQLDPSMSTWSFIYHWFQIKDENDRAIFKKMSEICPENPRRNRNFLDDYYNPNDRDSPDYYAEYLNWLKEQRGE